MIYKSDNIEKIAEALSGLQGELHDAYKSSSGYGYKYAELTTVYETIRPLLKKFGLSVTQPVGGSNNMIELNTILMHSSGQYISSVIQFPVDLTNKKMNSLQAAGSTITYLRRYCLCSIVGIATTDDDGVAGGEALAKEPYKRSTAFTPNGNSIANNNTIAIGKEMEDVSSILQVSEDVLEMARKQLFGRIIDLNVPAATVETWCARANVKSINQLNYKQIMSSLQFLDKKNKDDFHQDGDS